MMICRKLLYLCTFVALCVSCRTEDMYLSSIDENISNKFVVFTKRAEGKEVDYAKGFKVLAYRYDSLYDQNHIGKKAFELVSNGKLTSASYLEFRVHTKLVVEDNGDKWLVFPRVQSGNVVDLIYAGLTQDETYVIYRLIDKHSEFYKVYVSDFQKGIAYLSTKSSARNGGDDVTEIDTVVIPPKKGGNNVSFIMPDFSGGISDGGCDAYSNCIPGGMGGGGGSPKPKNNQDPCKSMKQVTSDKKYQEYKKNLESKVYDSYESGYRVGDPVAGSGQVGTQYQVLSNKPGTNAIDLKIFGTTFGIMHTHYEGLYPMFSPGDVYTFGQLLVNAQNNGIPLHKVFISLVTPAGNYQLRFDGEYFPGWSQSFDFSELNKDYISNDYLGNANGTQDKFEKGFLKFMKDKMNIDGAKLIREDYDGEQGNNQQLDLVKGDLVKTRCK